MRIIVIYLLTVEKYKFKAVNKNITLSTQFCLRSIDKYLLKEMCLTFQSITAFLINLSYWTFTSI